MRGQGRQDQAEGEVVPCCGCHGDLGQSYRDSANRMAVQSCCQAVGLGRGISCISPSLRGPPLEEGGFRVKQFPGREWEWVGDGWMGDGWVAPKTGSQQPEPIVDCRLSSDSLTSHSLLHFYGVVQRVGLGTSRT